MATNNHDKLNSESDELEKIIEVINNSILPRKMFDQFSFNEPSRLGALENYANLLLKEIKDKKSLGPLNDEWDRYWAREHAAADIGIRYFGGGYENYLPGRVLMYKGIVKGISDQGRVEGKKIYEIGGGSGIGLILLAQMGADVTNYDFSRAGLNFFEFLAKNYGVEDKIKTKRGDFYNIELPDGTSDVTYNVGVFEHLEDDERNKLMSEMERVTASNGIVLVAVPNLRGPHYQAMRERQAEYHRITGTKSPMEALYEVNIKGLMKKHGLEVIFGSENGVLLAPSSPITPDYFKPEDLDFYSRLPETSNDITDKIKAWKLLERSASQGERLKYGWFVYTIGKKLNIPH